MAGPRPILAAIACAALAACATNAERRAESMTAGLEAARQTEAACLAQARANPAVGRALAYIVTGQDDPAKLQKLSDPRQVDGTMRRDLIEAHQQLLPCRAAFKAQLAAVHPSYERVAAETFAAQDDVLLGLLNGQLSLGEANRLFIEIDRLSRDAWASADAALGQRLADEHAAELERRAAAASALQQWSSQQQALGRMNRPTMTSCYELGGQINCTTF